MEPLQTLSGRVLIAGYYGFGNAGDELILRAMLTALKSNTSVSSIQVLSGNPGKTGSEHGVESVNRWSLLKVLKSVHSCDVLALGGGGLLQDKTGSLSLWYYLLLLWAGILLGKKVLVYAMGVGPIRWRANSKLTGFTLNYVHGISVRDRQSLSELKKYGVKKEISVIRDPVLNLKVPIRSKDAAVRRVNIGLVARSVRGLDEVLFVTRISHALNTFAKEINGVVSILPFHPSLDLPISKMFHEKVRSSRIVSWDSLDELLDLFSGLDMTVCMRFHGLILSALFGIPALALESDPKMRHFIDGDDADVSLISFVGADRLGAENFEERLRELWKRTRDGNPVLT